MPEIPNLTDRIAELREYKHAKSLKSPQQKAPKAPRPLRKKEKPPAEIKAKAERPAPTPVPHVERPIALSPLVPFVYGALFAALIGQLFLLAMLDLL